MMKGKGQHVCSSDPDHVMPARETVSTFAALHIPIVLCCYPSIPIAPLYLPPSFNFTRTAHQIPCHRQSALYSTADATTRSARLADSLVRSSSQARRGPTPRAWTLLCLGRVARLSVWNGGSCALTSLQSLPCLLLFPQLSLLLFFLLSRWQWKPNDAVLVVVLLAPAVAPQTTTHSFHPFFSRRSPPLSLASYSIIVPLASPMTTRSLLVLVCFRLRATDKTTTRADEPSIVLCPRNPCAFLSFFHFSSTQITP